MTDKPPNFALQVRIIKTLTGMGSTGCSTACGFTAAEIHAAHNSFFPATPLALPDVDFLLRSGSRRGIYNLGGCSGSATAQNLSCETPQSATAETLRENQTFWVNPAMASRHYGNRHFQALNMADPEPCEFLDLIPPQDGVENARNAPQIFAGGELGVNTAGTAVCD